VPSVFVDSAFKQVVRAEDALSRHFWKSPGATHPFDDIVVALAAETTEVKEDIERKMPSNDRESLAMMIL